MLARIAEKVKTLKEDVTATRGQRCQTSLRTCTSSKCTMPRVCGTPDPSLHRDGLHQLVYVLILDTALMELGNVQQAARVLLRVMRIVRVFKLANSRNSA
ncbi:unnamed protein product [Leuciscus chuanchicus]